MELGEEAFAAPFVPCCHFCDHAIRIHGKLTYKELFSYFTSPSRLAVCLAEYI